MPLTMPLPDGGMALLKPTIVVSGLRAMLPLTMVKPSFVTPAALMTAKFPASPNGTAWPFAPQEKTISPSPAIAEPEDDESDGRA